MTGSEAPLIPLYVKGLARHDKDYFNVITKKTSKTSIFHEKSKIIFQMFSRSSAIAYVCNTHS